MENFSIDQIGQFFSGMETAESTFFLLCALISFLFGFLIAYLIRTVRVRSLKKAVATAEQERSELEVTLNTTKGKLKEAIELREFAERERIDLLDQIQQLKLDKDRATAKRDQLTQEVAELNRINLEYADKINDLQLQLSSAGEQAVTAPSDAADLERPPSEENEGQSVFELPAEGPEIVTALAGLSVEAEERLAALEERLAHLEVENRRLEQRLEGIDGTEEATAAQSPATPAADAADEEEPVVVNPDKSILGQRIITPDRDADDLTRIAHISDHTQSQLYQIGVFTYEDIAGWDPARIAQVTSLIGYLPGQIEKDNWVGQAAALVAGEGSADSDDSQTFGMSPPPAVDPENLQIIEGIGPKIEQVLKESGVESLAELAAREVDELRSMLIQAGDKYRMHDPSTWPKQAELAAAGNLEELEEYQEYLKGGREPEE
jgi:predicted flap endonuclease-1-like 5' DNA nuclease